MKNNKDMFFGNTELNRRMAIMGAYGMKVNRKYLNPSKTKKRRVDNSAEGIIRRTPSDLTAEELISGSQRQPVRVNKAIIQTLARRKAVARRQKFNEGTKKAYGFINKKLSKGKVNSGGLGWWV